MEDQAPAIAKTGCVGLAVGFVAGAVVGGVFELILFSMESVLKALPLVGGAAALLAVVTILIRKANDPGFSGFAKSALIGFLVSTLLMSGCYGIFAFGNINFH
jgi:hypothetical protein